MRAAPFHTPKLSLPLLSIQICRSKLPLVPVWELPHPIIFPPVVVSVLNQHPMVKVPGLVYWTDEVMNLLLPSSLYPYPIFEEEVSPLATPWPVAVLPFAEASAKEGWALFCFRC